VIVADVAVAFAALFMGLLVARAVRRDRAHAARQAGLELLSDRPAGSIHG
jgi:hypothetical protein